MFVCVRQDEGERALARTEAIDEFVHHLHERPCGEPDAPRAHGELTTSLWPRQKEPRPCTTIRTEQNVLILLPLALLRSGVFANAGSACISSHAQMHIVARLKNVRNSAMIKCTAVGTPPYVRNIKGRKV